MNAAELFAWMYFGAACAVIRGDFGRERPAARNATGRRKK